MWARISTCTSKQTPSHIWLPYRSVKFAALSFSHTPNGNTYLWPREDKDLSVDDESFPSDKLETATKAVQSTDQEQDVRIEELSRTKPPDPLPENMEYFWDAYAQRWKVRYIMQTMSQPPMQPLIPLSVPDRKTMISALGVALQCIGALLFLLGLLQKFMYR
jgi:hypothetical protein